MRFSVVTPNLNMASFLRETIESVLVNLRPGDEYFVMDGGSTDGSVEVIREYEDRLTGWVSEKDEGYADAVAKGFSRATGDVLCWVNAGDLLLGGALRAAAAALEETGADLVFGDDLCIDEGGRVLSHSHSDVRSLRFSMLFGGWTPLQDACFWRRDLYERVGGLDRALRYAADYDFFLRASCGGRCVHVPRIFSAFRRHEGQKSVKGAAAYEAERQACRRRALAREGVSLAARLAFEPAAWTVVRWRQHVRRRVRRGAVPVGALVRGMSAQGL